VRRSGVKFLLATLAPLVVALLQGTVGEASVPVYFTMALPALLWAVIPAGVLIYSAIKRRWVWAIANFVVLLFVALVHAGYCYGVGSVNSGPGLRVMTFNVQIFNNHSMDAVAAVIRREEPDVVCLQEMPTNGDEQKFAAILREYRFVNHGRLAIASHLPITRVERTRLGQTNRKALVADLEFADAHVKFINVHLQHFPADDLGKAGSASVQLLKEIDGLESLLGEVKVPTIVAGDLNSIPQGRVNRMLRSHLRDCFASAGSGYGYTIPAGVPLRRIDYIYAGGDLRPEDSRVIDTIASDHRAVVADVGLPE
jgi:vancomycin resistance protein VanJ